MFKIIEVLPWKPIVPNPEKLFSRGGKQTAFAPAHVVDGISYWPVKILQGRILSYSDAHRYRLGTTT